MICKNCSGEYASEKPACPYCGTENSKVAGKLKEEMLAAYDKEARDIKRQAERYAKATAHKWTKYILAGVGIALVAGVIIAVIAIASGSIAVNMSIAGKQKHMDKLEELYQAEDYTGIQKYVRAHDLWGREYDKYWQVANVYEAYARIEAAEEEIASIVSGEAMTTEEKKECSEYWIESILESGAKVLSLSEQYANDAEFLYNEDRLEEMYALCESRFLAYGYSAEEISGIRQIVGKADTEPYLAVLQAYFFR